MPVKVSSREKIFVLSVGGLLSLLTALPYGLGAALSSSDMPFSGFVIGQEDGYSYLCNMLQGRQGAWLYHLHYTSEPHHGELFFVFYLLLGKVAGVAGIPLPVAFHLSRLLLIPITVYAFFRLAAYFESRAPVRRLAVGLFAVGGGLGWLWVAAGFSTALGQMPVDLWVPDVSFFLSALTYPHLVLGQALLFVFVLFALRYIDCGLWHDAVWAALAGIGSSLVHPYTLPVIAVPLGAYAVWRAWQGRRTFWRPIIRLILVFLPSVPYLLYAWWVFENNFAFQAWQSQNLLYSPPMHLYLLGLGIPLILSFLGLALREEGVSNHAFLVIWLLAVPVLLYVPHPIQRRFIDGYQAPVSILAACGLYALGRRLPGRAWREGLTAATLLCVALTNVLLLLGAFVTVVRPSDPVYRPAWEVAAAEWFSSAPGYPVVLSSYATGNVLPGIAPVRVFAGHGSQTVDSAFKVETVAAFFDGDVADTWRRDVLDRFGILYIYHGPREKSLGSFDPRKAPYLNPVYDNGEVQIYAVIRDRAEG